MINISIIKDSDIGYEGSELNNPRIRYASRGIVIKGNKIAILNKANKNEFKLPGGGIEDNETPRNSKSLNVIFNGVDKNMFRSTCVLKPKMFGRFSKLHMKAHPRLECQGCSSSLQTLRN